MVKLRAALARLMYTDTCKLYRSVKITRGDITDKQFQLIAEFNCHLAQYGKELSAHRNDRAQIVAQDLRLNCSPDIEVLENDWLEITRGGQIFHLAAGSAFHYPTHQEISCRVRKEAKQ